MDVYGGSEHCLDMQHKVPCMCNLMPQCCVCPTAERVLRGYSGKYPGLPPMNGSFRLWCAHEADSAGEGAYDWKKLLELPDHELAYTVLTAWKEYVDDHF